MSVAVERSSTIQRLAATLPASRQKGPGQVDYTFLPFKFANCRLAGRQRYKVRLQPLPNRILWLPKPILTHRSRLKKKT
jgi:hypothetical protein